MDQAHNFHLEKWFLDFTSDEGEVMIFYAAKLKWFGIEVPYKSWIRYQPGMEMVQKSKFKKVNFPQVEGKKITWHDDAFQVEGIWENVTKPLRAKFFESEEGELDWNCLQPSSKVHLKINNQTFTGTGYVEKLILTAPPWKIPMDELRWGRFLSEDYNIVWVELRSEKNRQWLWLNGERKDAAIIEDDFIQVGEEYRLELDRSVVLEAEKKIFNVVEKLIWFIPGFKSAMPIRFLMADESKWFSKAQLKKGDQIIVYGNAIHELVNFKPKK
jgi:hypothetical protein